MGLGSQATASGNIPTFAARIDLGRRSWMTFPSAGSDSLLGVAGTSSSERSGWLAHSRPAVCCLLKRTLSGPQSLMWEIGYCHHIPHALSWMSHRYGIRLSSNGAFWLGSARIRINRPVSFISGNGYRQPLIETSSREKPLFLPVQNDLRAEQVDGCLHDGSSFAIQLAIVNYYMLLTAPLAISSH